MSEQVTHEMEAPKRSVGIDSLRERMADRTEDVARKFTKIWPIPGWEDYVAVELRMLSYRETRLIYKRAEMETKDEVTAELYGIADQVITATEGFHLIDDRGGFDPIEGASWMDVARSMPNANLPEDMTPRQALFALVGDRTLALWFSEFDGWQRRGGRDVGEQVMRDFGTTP